MLKSHKENWYNLFPIQNISFEILHRDWGTKKKRKKKRRVNINGGELYLKFQSRYVSIFMFSFFIYLNNCLICSLIASN